MHECRDVLRLHLGRRKVDGMLRHVRGVEWMVIGNFELWEIEANSLTAAAAASAAH